MIKYDFSGQIAIVTGGTRGIGGAVSQALLESGATVLAVHSGNEAAAADFAARNSLHGDRLKTMKCDVSSYEACASFFQQFSRDYPKLDILVNSAGIRRDSVLAMMPEESWRRVLDINLTGSYNMSKLAVLEMMQQRYGRIVCMTSPIGKIGFAGQANYAASKAGLVAMCKSLSKEVARRKITVNCISPGFIDTDFIAGLPEDQIKEYKASVPMRRFGRPEEIANAALFLCSQESEYINGSVLEVTGGF